MRYARAALGAALVLLATALAVHRTPPKVHLRVTTPRTLTACASADCGPHAVTLSWSAIPFTGRTGYNVFVNATQVADVTGTSYTFHGLDCGTSFTFGVQPHDAIGTTGQTITTAYSSPTCPVTGSAPVNTAEPVVTGTVATGSALTTTNGNWSGSPTSYSYQWQDCGTDGTGCTNITGATSSSYTVASGDSGHTIEANVTATNAHGSTTSGAPIVPAVDEFNGSSIDTNLWHVMNQQGDTSGNEQECYQPSNATETGGFANLTAEHISGGFACSSLTPDDPACSGACHTVATTHTATYRSAALEQINTAFTYGTVAVRMKMGGISGNDSSPWGAFWLLGAACQGRSTPGWLTGTPPSTGPFYCPWSDDTQDAGEIDIAEDNSQGSTSVRENLFNSGTGTSHGCVSNTISDIHTNFHTYELDWSPGSLVFKIDGVTQPCGTTSGVPSHPMFVILQLALQPVPVASDFPFTEQVDWVHVSH